MTVTAIKDEDTLANVFLNTAELVTAKCQDPELRLFARLLVCAVRVRDWDECHDICVRMNAQFIETKP